MSDDERAEWVELGRRIKRARKLQDLTLQDVATATGLSKSFISQVETGIVHPSIGSLKRISTALEIPIWLLLADDDHAPPSAHDGYPATQDVRVVRKDQRKVLRLPGTDTDIFLLTPDLQRRLEVSLSEIPPGHGYGDEMYTHRGEEFGLILEGRYEVTVGGETIVLDEGDSIYFPSTIPHSTRVLGSRPARTLWVNTPPSF